MSVRQDPVLGDLSTLPPERARRGAAPRAPDARTCRPWLALLLGIGCAPLAFVYVGRLGTLLALALLALASTAGAGWSGAVQTPAVLYALVVLLLVLQLTAMLVPWWIARRAQPSADALWYQRWFGYLAVAGAAVALLAWLPERRSRLFGFDAHRVPGNSMGMAPTLVPGDLIVVDTRPAQLARIAAGDVVVHWSERLHETVIKRVVAVPGQQVKVTRGAVLVDGVPLDGPGETEGSFARLRYPQVRLGADQFYVLGDNRPDSLDSRVDGPVARGLIRARVGAIFHATDTRRIGPVR